MEPVKPVILWLADNPDWAYASIVRQVSKCLPGYEHWVAYMTDRHTPIVYVNGELCVIYITDALSSADIVVPMYVEYKVFCRAGYMAKSAMMLTGMRPFE